MAETGALQPALTLADSEVSIRIPQIVKSEMAPKKRSPAQEAALARGRSMNLSCSATEAQLLLVLLAALLLLVLVLALLLVLSLL